MKNNNYDLDLVMRMNGDNLDSLIDILELNENRLYAWLVEDSPTVVRDDLEGAIDYVRILRKRIRSERPDYVSPYEELLPAF
jgi:hypothetical protein